ncbi:phosphatase and actin regulator 4-like [Tachysurus fulvidraco]|uniref:phosphatase and actin regulator 4-like n=1 Tax=Tachysurus fulvidraco TaxID=1234273 RepID=UPI001FEF07FE|nr:phosphatase and actin regulator 4-like [Tachysurus fulvidraco]
MRLQLLHLTSNTSLTTSTPCTTLSTSLCTNLCTTQCTPLCTNLCTTLSTTPSTTLCTNLCTTPSTTPSTPLSTTRSCHRISTPYPQPPMVETVEEECFFSSPELSQNQQPILPEKKHTLITFQCPNDDSQDIMVKELKRGTAMYEPESLFPGENMSVPQHVCPPEPASPPEPVSPLEHKPAYMIPNTKFQQEKTVHYVPATNTPDFAHTDNIYSMYNPEYYQVLPPDVYPNPQWWRQLKMTASSHLHSFLSSSSHFFPKGSTQ